MLEEVIKYAAKGDTIKERETVKLYKKAAAYPISRLQPYV